MNRFQLIAEQYLKQLPGAVVPIDYRDPEFESNQEHITLMERALERGVPVVAIRPKETVLDGNWYSLRDEIPEGFILVKYADFGESEIPPLSEELQQITDS